MIFLLWKRCDECEMSSSCVSEIIFELGLSERSPFGFKNSDPNWCEVRVTKPVRFGSEESWARGAKVIAFPWGKLPFNVQCRVQIDIIPTAATLLKQQLFITWLPKQFDFDSRSCLMKTPLQVLRTAIFSLVCETAVCSTDFQCSKNKVWKNVSLSVIIWAAYPKFIQIYLYSNWDNFYSIFAFDVENVGCTKFYLERLHTRPATTWTAVSTFVRSHQ